MHRCSLLAIALMAAFAARSEAQPVPRTITCNDGNGRAVTSAQAANGTIARATIDQDGRPLIQYDSRAIDGVTAQHRLFVYAHECGHHSLGHDARQPFSPAQEADADCYGVRSLMAKSGITSYDVMLLQAAMRDLGPDTARHLPWRARMYDLEGCLPEVISRRQAAARSGQMSADECVVHNDSENAIVSESRDRLTIDGVYSARNRCTRDIRCTFTIEVGTLPDSDIDLGSWRGFRVQKIITEEHSIAAGTANVEFGFRASVDTVRDGESPDFRVLTACR